MSISPIKDTLHYCEHGMLDVKIYALVVITSGLAFRDCGYSYSGPLYLLFDVRRNYSFFISTDLLS